MSAQDAVPGIGPARHGRSGNAVHAQREKSMRFRKRPSSNQIQSRARAHRWHAVARMSLATALPLAVLMAMPAAEAAPAGVLSTGYNAYGQLCNGTTTNSSTAGAAVAPLDTGVSATAGGAVHSAFLKSNGTIF